MRQRRQRYKKWSTYFFWLGWLGFVFIIKTTVVNAETFNEQGPSILISKELPVQRVTQVNPTILYRGEGWDIDSNGLLTIYPGGEQGTWKDYKNEVKHIFCEPGTKTTGLSNLFAYLPNVLTIDAENLDVSGSYDGQRAFMDDASLISAKVSSWNTKNVRSMDSMFNGCTSLQELDVSQWDTGNVTSMGSTFAKCKNLAMLDISNWNVQNVTNMSGMLSSMDSLTSLDLENWKTDHLVNVNFIFEGSDALTTVKISTWNMSQVTNLEGMFSGCRALETVDVSRWDTGNVTNMSSVFLNNNALKKAEVAHWNTSQVTNMTGMFQSCTSLTELDIANFDTSKVKTMGTMFHSSRVPTLDVSKWDTGALVDASNMFRLTSGVQQLDVSNWNTSHLQKMASMFQDSKSLEQLDLSNWDTSAVTDMNNAFNGVPLTTLDVSKWNTGATTNMSGVFRNMRQLQQLDLGNWNTQNVTDLSYIFANLEQVPTLDVANWQTSKVTNMTGTFQNISQVTTLDLTNWDMGQTTNMNNMFDFGPENQLWCLTLGKKVQLTDAVKLSEAPSNQTPILDETTIPLAYYSISPYWQEVGSDGTTHQPKGMLYKNTEIIQAYPSNGKARSTQTFVWQQQPYHSIQVAVPNLDFGQISNGIGEHPRMDEDWQVTLQKESIPEMEVSATLSVALSQPLTSKTGELVEDALIFREIGAGDVRLTKTPTSIFEGVLTSERPTNLSWPATHGFLLDLQKNNYRPGNYEAKLTWSVILSMED